MALRVVVAGAGPRGQDWIREVRNAPEYEFAACVDNDHDALRLAAAKLGLQEEQCFAQLNDALNSVACDAVIVATSAESHAEMCEAALTRDLAVLVEKPFTLTLSEARRLSHLAEKKGVPLVVAQNYRYMRSYRNVRRLVNEGALGDVRLINCHYYRVPHEMAASLARLKHSVLWGVGIHHLDAMRYVLGQNAIGVLNESFTQLDAKLPQGASMQTLLEFEGGARAIYSATYESSGHEFFERGQEFYARFVGTRATLHVNQRWLFLCPQGGWPRPVRRGARRVTEERVLLDQLRRAILDGAEPESSGLDNLQTMAIVEACVRSAMERRWINPQELLNETE